MLEIIWAKIKNRSGLNEIFVILNNDDIERESLCLYVLFYIGNRGI